ncbi:MULTISPECIES: hypothetical protein [unclassified Cellulophaga]|uniref:hypothetical protein n=1 Tax=unclassified Cellulophaga TaxID=2634405 RepID=UPI0026E28788|nr:MULTISPECIES: hypothetical protein [unclassified Cellulophaga]MDO6491394.1 hypothetical protein [Cellulophaga sp. 2_MG-2023]MDO6495073.1 hypothetical protein [Cellulophaga sp. 3_MG-2023]
MMKKKFDLLMLLLVVVMAFSFLYFEITTYNFLILIPAAAYIASGRLFFKK